MHKESGVPTSNELRQLFLDFFVEKGSQVLPSSPLVPKGDPTLLFTTAGMVQLKPFFLGQEVPPCKRLTSVQKCFRTTDIDCVGDAKHLTLFEMLGNFSVGDYFKKEAIAFAWEFVTQRLGLPRERLWTTVYQDDDEAFGLWRETGVPQHRIVRLGEKENFWGPAGDSGPCGPCSEIHYDYGEELGCCRPTCNPACDCGRFVEVWNLVFMQYNQDKQGIRTPLPKPNIDTGMGLERITAVMQGKRSVYQTDIFSGLLDRIGQISGKSYEQDEANDRAMRIIAEHSRGIAFLIADGVAPGNEGRSYVLRRLLRRASIFGRRIGLERPFLSDLCRGIEESLGHVYAELSQNRDLIARTVQMEEERFHSTLRSGLENLERLISAKGTGDKTITGQEAFMLYDTYGFPVELTQEVAADKGFTVDIAVFEQEMERQRKRAREASRFGGMAETADYAGMEFLPTEFVGYETIEAYAEVVGLTSEGKPLARAEAGDSIEIVLDRSPFYGEKGGQVGDKGILSGPNGSVEVEDTVWVRSDVIGHRGKVAQGTIAAGDTVQARVDAGRRADIARNHTATHILQAALREVLGPHVEQRGSLVAADRFRFDFSHHKALTAEEAAHVQEQVNEIVRRNLQVTGREMSYADAVAEGAMALFGEKYGDRVRLVQIGGGHCGGRPDVAEPGPVSAELCGGTHTAASGDIGLFLITGETSVGAGLRRIEGVTGKNAENLAASYAEAVRGLSGLLKAGLEGVVQKVSSLIEALDAERKRISQLERELSKRGADSLLSQTVSVDGIKVLSARVEASTANTLRDAGDMLRQKLGSAVVALGAVVDERPLFLVMVTPDLIPRGLNAGEIARKVAQVAGGGGGGRPEMAQAGGKDKDKLEDALKTVHGLVEKALSGTANK
ncbi:MAG: alanine--tRNA ligase [Chloroflexi bacterium]|nr:alanine--tRNA ligase [Chloroflexota bacterium]